jgi:hypothetical protein
MTEPQAANHQTNERGIFDFIARPGQSSNRNCFLGNTGLLLNNNTLTINSFNDFFIQTHNSNATNPHTTIRANKRKRGESNMANQGSANINPTQHKHQKNTATATKGEQAKVEAATTITLNNHTKPKTIATTTTGEQREVEAATIITLNINNKPKTIATTTTGEQRDVEAATTTTLTINRQNNNTAATTTGEQNTAVTAIKITSSSSNNHKHIATTPNPGSHDKSQNETDTIPMYLTGTRNALTPLTENTHNLSMFSPPHIENRDKNPNTTNNTTITLPTITSLAQARQQYHFNTSSATVHNNATLTQTHATKPIKAGKERATIQEADHNETQNPTDDEPTVQHENTDVIQANIKKSNNINNSTADTEKNKPNQQHPKAPNRAQQARTATLLKAAPIIVKINGNKPTDQQNQTIINSIPVAESRKTDKPEHTKPATVHKQTTEQRNKSKKKELSSAHEARKQQQAQQRTKQAQTKQQQIQDGEISATRHTHKRKKNKPKKTNPQPAESPPMTLPTSEQLTWVKEPYQSIDLEGVTHNNKTLTICTYNTNGQLNIFTLTTIIEMITKLEIDV